MLRSCSLALVEGFEFYYISPYFPVAVCCLLLHICLCLLIKHCMYSLKEHRMNIQRKTIFICTLYNGILH